MARNCHGREQSWQGTVMAGNCHGREQSWQGTVMAGNSHGKKLSWQGKHVMTGGPPMENLFYVKKKYCNLSHFTVQVGGGVQAIFRD